jgi:murein DD-endopeptidase MepM/ murein hydrolase activator NlpD
MIRPVDAAISQQFGENPTAGIRPGSPDYWIIQQFGNYQPDGHTGEDYSCPVGTPVRAVTSGVVLHVGWMGGTYADNPWWVAPGFAGYCAVIDHGGFIGIYGHCLDGSAGVSAGDRVAEGEVFIRSGNTGGSTGPHLHFEILPDRYVLNSRFYGRADPEQLFTGSLSYASESITPTEEDTLSAQEKKEIIDAVYDARDGIINDTRAQVKAAVDDAVKELMANLPGGVWSYRNAEITNSDAYQNLRDGGDKP